MKTNNGVTKTVEIDLSGAPELGSGRLDPAETPIFQSSGSGRN
jgi:hypothetical protein